MSAEPGTRRVLGYGLVILAAASWATGGLLARWLFVESALNMDPVELSAARAWIAAVVLLAGLLVFARHDLRVSGRDVPFLVAFGIAGQALLHLAYYEAIERAGVATAILLEYLAPVLVLTVSVVFLSQRLSWSLPAGVALAVSGCALVVGLPQRGELAVPLDGVLWGLLSAVLFATYMLLGQIGAPRMSSWTLLAYGLLVAAVFWTVVTGPSTIVETLADPGRLAAVAYVAVVSTVVPFGLFLLALRHIDATRAGVAATLEPVLAGVGAWVWLGESLGPWQLAGAVLVIVAIVLVQLPGAAPKIPPGT
jgi:drug/metabolite transporter (DMT)-like permease